MRNSRIETGRDLRARIRTASGLPFERLEPRTLFSVFTVTSINSAGVGTLRQAILDANASPGADSIHFNIPGAGVHTITPAPALPSIQGPTDVDASTQPGFVGSPLIALNGSLAGGGGSGLVLTGAGSSNSRIHGLSITRFGGHGVFVTGASAGNVITGNFIGVSPFGGSGGNGQMGVFIFQAGTGNRVGSAAPGDGNVVAANGAEGIQVRLSDAAVIQGNRVGTNQFGSFGLGNNIGIFLREANGCTVGGAAPGEGNLASGNRNHGISLLEADGNVIQGNRVGTDPSGDFFLFNQGFGVNISSGSSNNLLGGTNAGDRNIICYNDDGGVNLIGAGNTVQGNWIGVGASGGFAGNLSRGIDIASSNNQIGGAAPGAANTIANNSGVGVRVQSAGTGNAIVRNSIYNNGGLGIDLLNPAGPNPNDPGDADVGGNTLQNAPVVASTANVSGGTVVNGSLSSTPGTTFTVEFFANAAEDPSGFGEGQTFIGDAVLTTDAAGDVSFSLTFPAQPAGTIVTATATGPGGNTSEFSNAFIPNRPPIASDDFYFIDEDNALVADNFFAGGVLSNDFDPDGDALTATLGTGPSSGTLTFNADGTFVYVPDEDFFGTDQFTYSISDGEYTATATAYIDVFASIPGALWINDPCGDGIALLVNGTDGDDHILVTPIGNTGAYDVTLNGQSVGQFGHFGEVRLIVRGEEGNDDIQVTGTVGIDTWLFGESGNDRLSAGGNNGVLVGGSGDDQIAGGSGRDLLIGGEGGDRLVGNAGDDILISGRTDHDSNYFALCAVMDEWTRADASFQQRVDHLTAPSGGVNDPYFLTAATVHGDASVDRIDLLTSSAGNDWFIYELGEDRAVGISKTESAGALLI